ncbi:dTDP-4-dehydrorhamnose 3,5-epimerase [Thermodesulfobacteriota bacterium]
MRFEPLPLIPEVILIQPEIFEDGRGFFMEMYHQDTFTRGGIPHVFVQDNRSRSRQGAIRGLHYQLEHPQGKLVWALSGEVFDVALDIARGSPTFGKWVGTLLSGENRKGLYVPPHFAHGFCVLSKEAEIFYKCTDFYAPEHERCIRWDDPDIAVDWPIKNPILSPRDASAPLLKDADLPA